MFCQSYALTLVMRGTNPPVAPSPVSVCVVVEGVGAPQPGLLVLGAPAVLDAVVLERKFAQRVVVRGAALLVCCIVLELRTLKSKAGELRLRCIC